VSGSFSGLRSKIQPTVPHIVHRSSLIRRLDFPKPVNGQVVFGRLDDREDAEPPTVPGQELVAGLQFGTAVTSCPSSSPSGEKGGR
jgi:hypothetical protein